MKFSFKLHTLECTYTVFLINIIVQIPPNKKQSPPIKEGIVEFVSKSKNAIYNDYILIRYTFFIQVCYLLRNFPFPHHLPLRKHLINIKYSNKIISFSFAGIVIHPELMERS